MRLSSRKPRDWNGPQHSITLTKPTPRWPKFVWDTFEIKSISQHWMIKESKESGNNQISQQISNNQNRSKTWIVKDCLKFLTWKFVHFLFSKTSLFIFFLVDIFLIQDLYIRLILLFHSSNHIPGKPSL